MLNANNVPSSFTPREKLEIGNYPGRLVMVVDLGLQPQTYLGQPKEPVRKISTTYELLDAFLKDKDGKDIEDKPRWLSEDFPLLHPSADKATSTKRYKALDPANKYKGDWVKLLATPCMVNVIHNPNKKVPGEVYENIGGISPMRPKDAASAPKLVNTPVAFDLDDPDMAAWLLIPEWIQKKVLANLEFNGSLLQQRLQEMQGDNKPVKAAVGRVVPPADSVHGFVPEDEEAPW